MTVRLAGVRGLAAALILLVTPALAAAQESKSSQLAAELTMLLDAMKLDSVAAKIEGEEYVGALYFPGSQLLVVKAQYAVPQRMDAQLAGKSYRDAYIDLNTASVPDSKILISDLGADGLQARRDRDQPFDTADFGGQAYSFDGDWGAAGISRDEYNDAFQMADDEYARMLEALIAALK